MSEKITILIPAYNRRHSLEKAIESVRQQTYENWKLVLIDNNSQDGTYDWFTNTYESQIKSGKFQIQHFDKTLDIIKNWNRCLNYINDCDYIKFLWSDDILEPTFLEASLRTIASAGSDAVGFSSAIRYVDENGTVLGTRKYGILGLPSILSFIYRNNVGCPSSQLFRTKDYKNVKFDENNRYCADMLYALTPLVAKKKLFIFSEEALVNVTVAHGTETNTLFGTKDMRNDRAKFRKSIIELHPSWALLAIALHPIVTTLEHIFFTFRKA